MSHGIDVDLPREFYQRWECSWCADWGTNVQGVPCPHCERGRELAQQRSKADGGVTA